MVSVISQQTSASGVDGRALLFNPLDPVFNTNPYPHYERLRTMDPVHRSALGVWFVGRYEDVRSILKDRRFRVQDIPGQLRRKNILLDTKQISATQPRNLDYLIANAENWFAFLEAPDHTRLRGVFTGALHRHSVELLRPFIRDAARALIEKQLANGRMDLMKDFACILPLNVIARMLGVPKEAFGQVVAWTERLARIFDPLTSLEELAQLDRVSREFMAYLKGLIAERRVEPQDDLISVLCAERGAQDQQITEQELISVCILVFGAGEETMVNLLGNGTLALMNHPEQQRFLRENLDILPSAVDEFLRYDAPLQMTSRTALEDVEVGGKMIHAGDQVYVALGSANRDPERFERPDELDLERQHNHHMAFADGHHLCVGAQLARIEGQEGFRALLEMVPDLRLAADNLTWRKHLVLRGLISLPVTFAAQP